MHCVFFFCRHLSKLHKAVGTILPANQIRELYRDVHVIFKEKLRETLSRNGVVNNGGPQHGLVFALIRSNLTFVHQLSRSRLINWTFTGL